MPNTDTPCDETNLACVKARRARLYEEMEEIEARSGYFGRDNDVDHARYMELSSEWGRLLNVEMDLEAEQRRQEGMESRRYRRPDKGWLASLVNHIIPPFPDGYIKQPDPSGMVYRDLPSYRLPAALVAAVAFGSLLLIHWLFPATLFVPFIELTDAIQSIGMHRFFAWLLAAALYTVLYVHACKGGSGIRSLFDSSVIAISAVNEEQWFRRGAENWSGWQRFRSCAGFGLVHIGVLIYPLTWVLMTIPVGAVFMYVYLRQYSRSGDGEEAALAAAKFHAAFNRFLWLYLGIAVAAVIVYNLFL